MVSRKSKCALEITCKYEAPMANAVCVIEENFCRPVLECTSFLPIGDWGIYLAVAVTNQLDGESWSGRPQNLNESHFQMTKYILYGGFIMLGESKHTPNISVVAWRGTWKINRKINK